MPELPDIEAYRVALDRCVGGATLTEVQILHPFLLRSVGAAPESAVDHRVKSIDRLGKRIVIAFEDGPLYVIHLMIAGRFAWKAGESAHRSTSGSKRPANPAKGGRLARFAFSTGELTLTEAGTRRMASLHVLGSADELATLDPGGREVLDRTLTQGEFASILRSSNHTVKRSLTDPHLFSGIGNSYSDEILFAARLSPFAMTQSMSDEEIARLFAAMIETLTQWRDRLVGEARASFPKKVTAFRPEMYVHGKYGEACRVCGIPVQRIRYAENECNYCAQCQAGGKVYADRALSRLLKSDWPRTVEELERIRPTSR